MEFKEKRRECCALKWFYAPGIFIKSFSKMLDFLLCNRFSVNLCFEYKGLNYLRQNTVVHLLGTFFNKKCTQFC